MSWRRFAACRGQGELMFAEDRFSERVAVAVCESCGVRQVCLADALEVGDDGFGVRGGLTAQQRRARRVRVRPGPGVAVSVAVRPVLEVSAVEERRVRAAAAVD